MFLSRRAADLSLSEDQYYATETKCRLNQHKNISAADKNTQQIMNSFLQMRKLDKGCSLIENEGCFFFLKRHTQLYLEPRSCAFTDG